jgi:hypothetical protein
VNAAADHGAVKYRAFISYSQRDKRVARALQRALESYRVPPGVQPAGLAPDRRIGRIFRDDDELAASGTLSGALEGALRASENLIVVCSPHSAASHWVNEEIDLFRSLHGPERIYAIVIDGEPDSIDPERQCFPKALRGGDDLGDAGEPLAPDLRKDGQFRAVTKLVAGMLEVNFDDLWRRGQRAARRQAQRRFLIQAGVLVVIAGLIGALYVADTNQITNLAYVARAYFSQLVAEGPSAWTPSAAQRSVIDQAKAAARMHVRQDFDLELRERDAEAGWTIAQENLALHEDDQIRDASALALLGATRLHGASCWPEYVADGACHVLATSWALYSMGTLGVAADAAALNSLLDVQNAQGWWPLYFTLHGDRADASTYATAWALMAIGSQARFADPATQKRIEDARARAIGWLVASEDRSANRWKDYPYSDSGTALDGVSALAVVALNPPARDGRIADLDRGWLDHLPAFPGKLDLIERSNVALGRSWKWDRTSYAVTPWVALSADLAFPTGDRLGRAKAKAYLERFTSSLPSYQGPADPYYFSAELAHGLTRLSRSAKP